MRHGQFCVHAFLQPLKELSERMIVDLMNSRDRDGASPLLPVKASASFYYDASLELKLGGCL